MAAGFGAWLVVGEVIGGGRGYFKLQYGTAAGQDPVLRDGTVGHRLLVQPNFDDSQYFDNLPRAKARVPCDD